MYRRRPAERRRIENRIKRNYHDNRSAVAEEEKRLVLLRVLLRTEAMTPRTISIQLNAAKMIVNDATSLISVFVVV